MKGLNVFIFVDLCPSSVEAHQNQLMLMHEARNLVNIALFKRRKLVVKNPRPRQDTSSPPHIDNTAFSRASAPLPLPPNSPLHRKPCNTHPLFSFPQLPSNTRVIASPCLLPNPLSLRPVPAPAFFLHRPPTLPGAGTPAPVAGGTGNNALGKIVERRLLVHSLRSNIDWHHS